MKKNANFRSKKELLAELESENFARKTLSFYKYVQIADVHVFRDALYVKLNELNCRGRVYVAPEGINAQMNVPEHKWDDFDNYIQNLPELSGVPYKIAVEEKGHSFIKLIVRIKDKIVADGLDDSTFDSSNTGDYLTAEDMNKYVESENAVVVDMRNSYESEVGHFKGAITPDVDTFREELLVINDELADKKDVPIALYCTGGIRCEKASAWMKHNGFTDVRHLKGGIIDYAKQVEEKGLENNFLGKNFVFDERMGERVGNEIISHCHLCHKNKSDEHFHCQNQTCHVLFLGCGPCMEKKKGYCSFKCKTFDTLPKTVKKKLSKSLYKKDAPQFKKNILKSKIK